MSRKIFHKTTISKCVLVCLPGLLKTSIACGQDALQSLVRAESFNRARTQSRAEEPLRLRLGPVDLNFNTFVGLTYDDNVFLSENDARDDWYIRAGIGMDAFWPISDHSTLNATWGGSYEKYFQYSDKDRLSLTQSSISYDYFEDHFDLNVHDRFSLSQEPGDNGSVNNVAKFGGFENSAGVQTSWNYDLAGWMIGYDHYNFISTTAASDRLQRTAEYLVARSTLNLYPFLRAGPEFSTGFTRYDQPILSDNENYSIGGFVDTEITAKLHLEARGGYSYYTFDPSASLPLATNHNSWYLTGSLAHHYNSRISQSLDGGYVNELGTNSNLKERLYGAYHVGMTFNARVSGGVSLHAEKIKEGLGMEEEEYLRYGVTPQVVVNLSHNASLQLAYSFLYKNSDLPNRSYKRNQVSLQAAYHF